MPKTIFMTGASTGLGRATATLFHAKGWLAATMRKPEAGVELQALDGVEVLALDVTDAGQIVEASAAIEQFGKIDVVFNNAGYGLAGPLEALTDAQLQRQLATDAQAMHKKRLEGDQAFIDGIDREFLGD